MSVSACSEDRFVTLNGDHPWCSGGSWWVDCGLIRYHLYRWLGAHRWRAIEVVRVERRVDRFARIRRDARLEGLGTRKLASRYGVPEHGAAGVAVSRAPTRQRLTATRIWNRLVDEHAAEVGYPSVRDYVRPRRSQIAAEVDALTSVAVVPQHARGAEPEVDFGEFWIDITGVLTKVFIFVFRMSHSGKVIHRVYPTLSQEPFLEGHVSAFEEAWFPRCRSSTTTSARQ